MALLTGNPAVADVAGELQNMFNDLGMSGSSSSGGAYYSQSRGYLMGGSVMARSPTKYVSPATIQLPDMKAGCGGVDMFFGGFQFINAEEFKRFLQNAGTAAIGYAFHMALQTVCPTCDGVLRSLRGFADSINKFGLDSCTAAKASVNMVGGPLKANLQTAIANSGGLSGTDGTSDGFWSPVKGWLDQMGKSVDELHQSIYDAASDPSKTLRKVGISTQDNIRATGANTLTEEQMEIAISILGTKGPIVGLTEGTEVPMGECTEYSPLITLSDILEGSSPDNPLNLWRCTSGSFSDGTCERIAKAEISNFTGFKEYSLTTLTSIKEKMVNEASMSAEEKAFINSVPFVPIRSSLSTAITASSAVADALVANISDLVAVAYAMYVITSYAGIYKNSAKKLTCGDLSTQRYMDVMRMAYDEFQRYTRNVETVNQLIAFLSAIDRVNTGYASKRTLNSMKYLGW